MFGGEFVQRRVNVKPRFWLFLIVCMVVCFAMSSAVAQIHYNHVSQRVHLLSTEKLSLVSHITQLNDQLRYMQTDDYIERIARDELNMIMPGEIRYVSN